MNLVVVLTTEANQANAEALAAQLLEQRFDESSLATARLPCHESPRFLHGRRQRSNTHAIFDEWSLLAGE